MPSYPDEAVQDAAEAIMSAQNANDDEPERFEARVLARAALDAAWPHLADAVAGAILAHMEAHGPPLRAGDDPLSQARRMRRAWQRHFRIAAGRTMTMADGGTGVRTLTQWGSRDQSGRVFAYGGEPMALHGDIARRAVRWRREKGLSDDVLLRRTITIGPWEEVPEDEDHG